MNSVKTEPHQEASESKDRARRPAARDEADQPNLEEICTPIELEIEREAERAVCSKLPPGKAAKKTIVSVNGKDVDEAA